MWAGIDVGAFKHAVSVKDDIRLFDAHRVDDIIDYLSEHDIQSVVLEPTGIYHLPLARSLLDAGFKVFMIHSTRFGRFRAGFGKKKGDEEDAKLLRKYAETGEGFLYEIDDEWIDAKTLGLFVQEHMRTTKSLTSEMNRLRRDIYLVDPALAFMTPSSYKYEYLKNVDFGDFTQYILSRVKAVEELREKKKKLEKQIKDMVKAHPDGEILTSIPGISYITAGLLISTYVNVERYKDVKHFKSMLGFGLNVKDSGSSVHVVKSSKAHIPIRAALFRVVISNVRRGNKISEYYEKYKQRMPFKKAVMRTAAKLIEWIYYMLKRREMWKDE